MVQRSIKILQTVGLIVIYKSGRSGGNYEVVMVLRGYGYGYGYGYACGCSNTCAVHLLPAELVMLAAGATGLGQNNWGNKV